MGFFHHESEEADAYNQVTDEKKHKSAISHQLIAAAAAYETAKAWNKHKEEQGEPPSHAKAKEIIAAVSGAFVDRMVETKGLDFIDAQKAKHEAKKRAEEGLANSGLYPEN